MDSAALDDFFARCEDVLTDWHGGDDAMRYEVGEGDEPEAQRVDSYYEQTQPALPGCLPPTLPWDRLIADWERSSSRISLADSSTITVQLITQAEAELRAPTVLPGVYASGGSAWRSANPAPGRWGTLTQH